MARAQGNPFYLEELLNYVRDRGLDPADIQNIELPDSLHTLILSRIDQLSEREKSTLRVASIVGRLFRANG
jgi:adenylate cyclase